MMSAVMAVDDGLLMARVKNGDEEAFHQLFETHRTSLFKLICYKAHNYDLAEDIVQETFVRVWTARDTLKPELSFFSLIARIGQNLLQDHYKHQAVRTKHKDHVKFISEKPCESPEQELKLNRLQQRIHEIADTALPNKCRNIFLLSRVAGLSNQEIADQLQITKKTVENQLHNALKVLRKKCADYL